MIVSRSGTEYPRPPPLDAVALQERELVWARLPKTFYQGTTSCLSVGDCLCLDSAMTNKEMRPHLVKSYKDMESAAFNQHVYTSEDDFGVLRWVMERDINLKGFRLELKYINTTVREPGFVLIGLMNKKSICCDMKIAEYYARRGKLTNLDASYGQYTALTYASMEGHLNMVEALLAAGADKDKGDSGGHTPTACCAEYGHVECLNVLLAAGGNADKISGGFTPLMSAAQRGHIECLNTLLSAGVDKDKVGWRDYTPLMWAASRGKVECVKALLAVKADVHKANASGKTPWMVAYLYGHREIFELLQAVCAEKDSLPINP